MDLCCELQKLPVLFEHYQELEEESGISFWSFLDIHYGDGSESENIPHQDEHDSNLPFNGQHQCCHGQIFMVHLFVKTDFNKQVFISEKGATEYNFSTSTSYLDSPFQPPKA